MKRTMKKNTGLSTLELAILSQIYGRPASGYEIRKLFIETPARHFSSSPGAIYPALKRLENAGLITGTVEQSDTLRPKKVYQLSSDGASTMREHVSQDVSRADIATKLDELILRFGLLESLCGIEACECFLLDFAEKTNAYTQELKRNLQDHQQSQHYATSLSSQLAHEYGIEVFTKTNDWAKHALEAVQNKLAKSNVPQLASAQPKTTAHA